MLFADREEAGRLLTEKLKEYKNAPDMIVLGLPRGGVVVAFQIASRLGLPLDITIPRKIGAPGHEEYAIGAIDETGKGIWNEEALVALKIAPEHLFQAVEREKKEILRRLHQYRSGLSSLEIRGKTILLVDDGVATGFTVRSALRFLRQKNAGRIVLVAPVIARDTLELLRNEADDVIYLEAPNAFGSVGRFYREFDQTSDAEVVELLSRSPHPPLS